jgi:hypothetical protein
MEDISQAWYSREEHFTNCEYGMALLGLIESPLKLL